jgi:hypothetical protein
MYRDWNTKKTSYYLADPMLSGENKLHNRLQLLYAPLIWIDENIFDGPHCIDAGL